MKPDSSILFRSLVQPFYKENVGLFVFVFAMMFFIVSKVDGAGLYEYHYSLVTGMLTSSVFLLSVLFIWLIYVRKYVLFVSDVIINPQYTFLGIYNQLTRSKRFRLLFIVQLWLLSPVLLYVIFIVFVGLQQQLYLPVIIVISYLLIVLTSGAIWHVQLLNNPYKSKSFSAKFLTGNFSFPSSYIAIVIRYVLAKQPVIFTGIKIFTCGILYLTARNNNASDNDFTIAFMFYNFGLLANGVLILRLREFEHIYLNFYRSLPVPIMKRLLQYVTVFFILLIPEFIIVIKLMPYHLTAKEGFGFILNGFSLLLLMNSITFLQDFKMKDYIKMLLLLLCVEYIFLITIGITFLYLFFFALAVIIFIKRYYIFEQII